jgi:hypothetical protein
MQTPNALSALRALVMKEVIGAHFVKKIAL